MNTITVVIELVLGVYIAFIGFNLSRFQGRQKNLVLASIPDQEKAASYGQEAGRYYILAGIGIVVLNVVYMLTKSEAVSLVDEVWILLFLILIMKINKKYTGKVGLLMY